MNATHRGSCCDDAQSFQEKTRKAIRPASAQGHWPRLLFIALVSLLLLADASMAQRREPSPTRTGGFTLMGNFNVDEKEAGAHKPLSFDLILYNKARQRLDQQRVGSKSVYRFMNISAGEYEIAVESDGVEVARVPILIGGETASDVHQDINLEWRANMTSGASRPGTISAADLYTRPPATVERFEKARKAADDKQYEQAAALLSDIVREDPKDFQAWTELGTASLALKKYDDAEKAYKRAIEEHPNFFLALLSLGHLRLVQKNYEGAIEALTQAVKVQPQSADANAYLGEAYLQIKKGSLAVGYLNEAIRLDPQGKADLHLRLAALYRAVGMNDKAVAEYEQLLAAKPDHPKKKEMQDFIKQNKKP